MSKAITTREQTPEVEQGAGLAQLVAEGHAIVRIENDTLQQVALSRPRPTVERILKESLAELEAVPEFATLAFYSIPYREKKDDENAEVKLVEGPSVKAAHTLVRMYRNTSSGNRIVGEDENFVYTQGVMIDLESNTRKLVTRRTSKRVWNKRTQSTFVLSSDRLNTVVGADASKAERNAILNLLPPSLVIPYVRRAKEIAAQFKTPGKAKEKVASAADRWNRAVSKFAEFGVQEAQLTALLATVNPEASLDEKIGTLIGVYNAIKDGHATVEETFGAPAKRPSENEATLDALLNGNAPVTTPSAPPPAPPPASTTASAPLRAPEAETSSMPLFTFDENQTSLFGGGIEFDGEIAPGTDEELERLAALRHDIEVIIRQLVPEYPAVKELPRAKVVSTLFARAFKIDGLTKLAEVPKEKVEAGLAQMRRDVQAALSTRGGKAI